MGGQGDGRSLQGKVGGHYLEVAGQLEQEQS